MQKQELLVVAAAALVAGCSSDKAAPTSYEIRSPLYAMPAHAGQSDFNFNTHLTGDEEAPQIGQSASPAQGQAVLRVSDDGLSVDFQLIASNIDNITQAHIHCGPAGVNGPIIVWLYPSPTATVALPGGAGRHDGVLAERTIVSGTPLHVRSVPSSSACPGGVSSFADVLAKIRANNTYVNVHTSDGVNPPNTGPGDFPGGEIRGQLE